LRSSAVALVPAAVVAAAWLRLEQPREVRWRVLALVALALVPALSRRRTLAAWVAVLLGARVAIGTWSPHRFGSRFANGFLDFYDVRVPFDPRTHAEMRGVVLFAIFGFVLALGLALALRRPVVAAVIVVVGAGWPATLASEANGMGIAILLSVLVVLAGTGTRRVPRLAIPVALAVALVALVATGSSAVAKDGLVRWQQWDFYDAPDEPVSVAYVWNAQYGGISFPAKRTTVLEVEAPRRSLYWRAAVLDFFGDDRWLEADLADVPAPRGALVRQDVTVKALSDTRLVGATVPVRFDAGDVPLVRGAGAARVPGGLARGFRYSVWSHAPQPTPAQLRVSPPVYPTTIAGEFLDVWPGVAMPSFGAGERAAAEALDAHPEIARYTQLEKAAFAVAGRARSPYGATVALERWFLGSGGFTYTNHPALFPYAPLVGFVAQTRAGYCQHFAGAMALMLRYLGVPARVAVGFSSGTYDAGRRVWTVTDHDAHAWVEAWFRGYGWLAFDPTPAAGRPARGGLAAPYVTRRSAGAQAPAQQDARHREGRAPNAPTAAVESPSQQARLLLLLAVIAAAGLGGIVGTKLAVRRVRYLTRNPREVAAACRQELADFLLDQRIDAARSATLHELGALVRGELAVDPNEFVAAATAARFGPPTGAHSAARDARRELRALVRLVRKRLTRRERARGLLSLRSLGLAP
jgi:transglutaminase-like putative cysteine protease